MKKLSFLIFLIGFLLFRPGEMERYGLMYPGDDESYFAHATSIAYGQFPSYKKEYYTTGKGNPIHPIGPGLMAAPFVHVFSWVDRLTNNSIVQQRQKDNVQHSWSAYGFMVSSVFYLWFGCFLLYRGLRHHFGEFETVLSVFVMILCQGIPLFAFRRPVFSHISEFCIISALVWLILLPREQWRAWSRRWISAFGLGILLGLLILIRQNNILMVFLWPIILFVFHLERQDRAGAWKKILLAYATAGILFGGLQVFPDLYYQNDGQNVSLATLSGLYPFMFYCQRLWHVLTGLDWGLIYTAPFILIGLLGAVFFRFPLRRVILISLLPLLLNLYIVIAWKTQGGWYGYRYLIAAATPLCLYPLAFLLSRAVQRFGKVPVLVLSLALSLFPLLSMLAFEGNMNLNLQIVMQYFGEKGWGNNTYQWNVWMMLWHQPSAFWEVIAKGGVQYVLVCVRMIVNSPELVDTIIRGLYLKFSPVLLVQTLTLYAMPFMLTCVADLLFARKIKRV